MLWKGAVISHLHLQRVTVDVSANYWSVQPPLPTQTAVCLLVLELVACYLSVFLDLILVLCLQSRAIHNAVYLEEFLTP